MSFPDSPGADADAHLGFPALSRARACDRREKRSRLTAASGKEVLGKNVMANVDLRVCGLAELETVAGYWDLFASFADPGLTATTENTQISFARRAIFRFHDVIYEMPGRVQPSRSDIIRWIGYVRETSACSSASILINCHLGLSRSVAAAAIVIGTIGNGDLRKVPETLFSLSPRPWPNSRMLAIADDLLNLKGKLSTAGFETRLETARRHPDWIEKLAATHRTPEVQEVRPLIAIC